MLVIRPAAERDYAAIVRWDQNRKEPYLRQWSGPDVYRYPLTEGQIARQAGRDGVHLYMACDGETPIGTGEISGVSEAEGTGNICRLLFAEEARNKGFGEAFLKGLSRIAFAQMGLSALNLRVFCFNIPAIRCYEKVGFRVKAFFEEADPHWNNYWMEYRK